MFLHVWDYFLDFCNIPYSQITLLGFCIGYIRAWTFLKDIWDYEINYKFHLSPLEAAKNHSSLKNVLFVWWNIHWDLNLASISFFPILEFTFLGTILSILKICAFHELLEVENCWIYFAYFGCGFHLKIEVIYTVYCSSFFPRFFYLTSYKFTLHNFYPVHM